MKLHRGVWFPDGEAHMIEWCDKNGQMVDGKTTYQYKKWLACIPWIKNWRVAVDVGAHIGFWSTHLYRRFSEVEAFEPVEAHHECFEMNIDRDAHYRNTGGIVNLFPVALGAAPGMVSLTTPPGSSGGTHISGPGDIEMRTLDSFEFEDVDFLKIDVEGYELAVLQGAVETLKRCRPCVIVEQKNHTPGGLKHIVPGDSQTPAVDFLRSLGAHLRTVVSGDFIMAFD